MDREIGHTGCLIAIESPDDQAESQITETLVRALTDLGHKPETFSFKSGSKAPSNPYEAALTNLAVLLQQKARVLRNLEQGRVVVASGYTGSLMADSGLTFEHAAERRGFYLWLEALIYKTLELPRPNLHTVVHRNQLPDNYQDLVKLFNKDIQVLEAKAADTDSIASQIVRSAQAILPINPSKPAPDYVTPDELSGELRSDYIQTMDRITSAYASLPDTIPNKAFFLPVAAQPVDLAQYKQARLAAWARQQLNETYTEAGKGLKLIGVRPRSENDLLTELIYQFSGLSYQELSHNISKWPISQKQDKLVEALVADDEPVLRQSSYNLEIVSETANIQELIKVTGCSANWQALTPRYGYDIPAGITDVDEDLLLSIYDLSLALHSRLSAAKLVYSAQLATLGGHINRAVLTLDGSQLQSLVVSANDSRLGLGGRELARQISVVVGNHHPITVQQIEGRL